MGNLDTLLLWNAQDPVSDAERTRNDQIYSLYQHNRNPFVDHPEYVSSVWSVAAVPEASTVGAGVFLLVVVTAGVVKRTRSTGPVIEPKHLV